jgi:tetratricopeptide (TPR) repeat protein
MKVKKVIKLLLLAIVLLPSLPLGAQDSEMLPYSLSFSTTRVIGVVLDEGRAPVSGIRLELELAPDRELESELNLAGTQLTEAVSALKTRVGTGIFTTAVTDEKGQYQLKGVPIPGVYYVHVRNAENFLPTWLKLNLNSSEEKEYKAPDIVLRTRKEGMGPVISPKAMKEVEKSRNAMAKKDLKNAIKHMKQALKLEPRYAEGYYNLGVLYMTAKNRKEAIEHIEKAAQLQNDYKPALQTLGDLYFFKKDYQEALKYNKRFLAIREKEGNLTPADLKVYFQAGNCNKALGQKEAAVTFFAKYLELGKKTGALGKKDAVLSSDIAGHYYMKKDIDKAIPFYGQAIELDPAVGAEVYLYLANCYLYKKDGENALAYYRKYVKLFPDGKHIVQVKTMVEKLEKMYPDK